MSTRHNQKGFTLPELLLVMVIIAILALIGILAYGNIKDRADDTKRRRAAEDVRKNIELLIVKKGILTTHSPHEIGDDGICKSYTRSDWESTSKGDVVIGQIDNGGNLSGQDRAEDTSFNLSAGKLHSKYVKCNLHDMLVHNKLLPDDFWQKIPKTAISPRISHTIVHCWDEATRKQNRHVNADGMYLVYAVVYPTEEETKNLEKAINCTPGTKKLEWVIRSRANAAVKVNVHQVNN